MRAGIDEAVARWTQQTPLEFAGAFQVFLGQAADTPDYAASYHAGSATPE